MYTQFVDQRIIFGPANPEKKKHSVMDVHGCTRLYIHEPQHQNKVSQIELACTTAMEEMREMHVHAV
jgi:hypothetical protein